ncbi:methyltransferase domain-containing protein [Brevibacillus laterosporus]|uniref:methyltransferase domain-containing protein n=1 Tax=Brevibacillus laterosporus TaxID=1465 RepID=UPI000B9A7FE9
MKQLLSPFLLFKKSSQILLISIHVSRLSTLLPYSNETFSKIFCISVIEYMELSVMYRTFCECARVLKKDGLFIITCDVPPLLPDQLATVISRQALLLQEKSLLGNL